MVLSSHSEKRRQPRVDNNISLKITSPGLDLVTETRNISASGVYCRVNFFLEPMTKLKVVLLVPVKKGQKVAVKKVVCGGVVVRTENITGGGGFNAAIFFNDIHPQDSRLLADFVAVTLAARDNSIQAVAQ